MDGARAGHKCSAEDTAMRKSDKIQAKLQCESRKAQKMRSEGGRAPAEVQEARQQLLQCKQKLRDLKLEYNMLNPARLRVIVGGKALIFTDPQKLQLFIAKRETKGQRRNTQVAGEEKRTHRKAKMM
ncbi:hypothetical protein NDU88_005348 [Pleurodeles waltl]|uniref:Uncharacterized protein n=1 Tax=Pleurodeles waltl TaxID=8319 RepID=A0AAV7WD43_PLEWA|nr:hypothetical protein NDU88_005348 [Pleurodeles waltl]